IAAIEYGVNDNGAMIQPTFQTRFRTQGQPTEQKHYSELQIEHRLNNGILNVYAIFDQKGSTQTLLGTITSNTDKTWSTLPIPDFNDGEEPRSIAIRLETNTGASDIMEVFTINLRYYVVPSGGVVFDSGNIKLAEGNVCLLQDLELDLENLGAGTVSYEWQSDLPGRQVQRTAGANIDNVVGIGTFSLNLGVKEARWGRLIVRVSSGLCRVYGARIQIRPIGLYLAGTGDSYTTAELNAGSPRLKLFSALRFNTQLDGDMPVHLLTDVPPPATGTALAEVATATVPATTERQWFT